MKLHEFVPKAMESNKKALLTAKMILQLDAAIAVLSIVLGFTFANMEFHPGVYVCVFSLIGSGIHPLLMHRFDGIAIPSHFFCFATMTVFCVLSYYTGGSSSSFLFWTIIIVPIGLFYLELKHTIFWVVVTAIVLMAFIVGDLLFLFPENIINVRTVPWVNLANIVGLCVAFIYIVVNFKIANAKMTKKLAGMNVKLKESNNELEKFASIASHDLKSPLRNISGFSTMLKMKFSKDLDPKALEFIDIIESNANSMTRLIEDILEYSRSSGTSVKREMVNLNKTISMIKSQLSNSGVFPNATIKIEALPNILCDKTRIHQVFQNLIENGLKYNKAENRKVDVRYHCRNNQHHFEFSDNGIGINPKNLEKIFEMFQRLHNQKEYAGSGIGLATTKKSVEIMGGTINVISVEGRGSTFRVVLPKQQEDYMPNNTELRADLASID